MHLRVGICAYSMSSYFHFSHEHLKQAAVYDGPFLNIWSRDIKCEQLI